MILVQSVDSKFFLYHNDIVKSEVIWYDGASPNDIESSTPSNVKPPPVVIPAAGFNNDPFKSLMMALVPTADVIIELFGSELFAFKLFDKTMPENCGTHAGCTPTFDPGSGISIGGTGFVAEGEPTEFPAGANPSFLEQLNINIKTDIKNNNLTSVIRIN